MKQRLISLFLLLACLLSLAVPVSAASTLPFKDVGESRWFYTYVKDLYHDGVIDGVSAVSFDPDGTVTLAQALKLFLLIGGYGEQAPTTTHWASGYYHLANKKGFLGSAKSLTLDQPVTRLQIAELAANVLGLTRTSHSRTPFADTMNLSVLALSDYGIITGSYEDGKLCYLPKSKISRAELSAILWRIRDLGLDTQSSIGFLEEEPAEQEPQEPQQPSEPDTPTYTGAAFTFNGRTLNMAANVPACPYNTSLFQYDENGYMTYTGSSFDCQLGIDVSRYQGIIDWAAVKKAGIRFAILRAGYRGYGQAGTLVQDSCFLTNIRGAIAQGIPVGVYFFSQATSREEAVEEANYVLQLVKDYKLSLPIAFDWEPYPDSKNPRTKGLSDKVLTQCAVAFCETIEKAGYQPMVYANLTYFYLHFDISKFADYPLWLAQYNKKPSFRYNYLIWQYGSKGSVPGIQGDVDMDIMLTPKK